MMKFHSFLSSEDKNRMIGNYLLTYKIIYTCLMFLLASIECVLLIRFLCIFTRMTTRNILYLSSYIFLLTSSLSMGIFLIVTKFRSASYKTYNIIMHAFATAMFIWAVVVTYLDVNRGTAPLVFLTTIVTLAGVVLLDPVFFSVMVLLSAGVLIGLDSIDGFNYFVSAGEFINFFIFIAMGILISVRHYWVSVKEFKSEDNLKNSVLEERNRVSAISLETIKSISNAVDAKDKYTREHSQRVAEYSRAIAERLGWPKEKAEEIHEIALLHDIGKIGVPDSILNCTTRLTKEQYEMMKQHTVIGGEILKDLTILKNVDLGAKYHHERFDGTGYPSGLKGYDIPIEARIIAVADAFDAMNSNRIYRNKLTKEKILSELIEGKGKQFDPDIIDVFMPYAEEILKQSGNEDSLKAEITPNE